MARKFKISSRWRNCDACAWSGCYYLTPEQKIETAIETKALNRSLSILYCMDAINAIEAHTSHNQKMSSWLAKMKECYLD